MLMNETGHMSGIIEAQIFRQYAYIPQRGQGI